LAGALNGRWLERVECFLLGAKRLEWAQPEQLIAAEREIASISLRTSVVSVLCARPVNSGVRHASRKHKSQAEYGEVQKSKCKVE
jgi:hypothetical protein